MLIDQYAPRSSHTSASWSQPLRLLISQTDSSLPAAPPPGAQEPGPHPSAARLPARPSRESAPGVAMARGWGRRLGHPIRGKFHRRGVSTWSRVTPGKINTCPGSPFERLSLLRAPLPRELLISSVSETRAAPPLPGFIFY